MNRREFICKGTAAAAVTGFTAAPAIGGGADKLALFGGTPVFSAAARKPLGDLFAWPIVNEAMRKANDLVLVQRKMSGTDVADEFERKFAAWNGTKYASSAVNGTASLLAAFYAVGLGPGDELICPSITYWASCLGAIHLGATVVFCDVKPEDLTADPASIEAHITPRTKAIVVVHLYGAPCDMDPIMAIAKKHGLKVIEDVSHAQGGSYKGRRLGTIGDCGAMSLMTGKSFAIGEGGMFVTNDEALYRRVVRWGQYERIGRVYRPEETARTKLLPIGGAKNRLNQCSAAIGLEQLKKYDAEREEIERAMLYYWDGIRDVKGLRKMYPSYAGSNKAGWYYSRGAYDAAAFGGLPAETFCAALNAEIGEPYYDTGVNFPLHTSSLFDDEDVFANGRPPCRRHLPEGVTPAQLTGRLPVAESRAGRIVGDPWFKHLDKPCIDRFVEAVHKVAANAEALKAWKPAAEEPKTLPGWNRKS